jgi:GTP cyclohydrolase I
MFKQTLNMAAVEALAHGVAWKIHAHFGVAAQARLRVYPVPRGGIPATLALLGTSLSLAIVDDAESADFIMDDLIDSGATRARYPDKPFFALIDKPAERAAGTDSGWIVWPWEGDAVGSMEDNVRRMLQFIGEDVTRGGLVETPARVTAAWTFWTQGYNEDPGSILKTFEDGATDEMVMVRDIPFYTHCEHHMAPFFGTATVGYVPSGKIVGLSKLSRLVACFARRLQVQERLTGQIADALVEHLAPKGVGVVVTARHLCMESRGVCQQGSSTVTSALRGVMLDGTPRQEFLHLAK